MGRQISLEGEPSDGAVRIGEIVIPGVELADGGGSLFVGDADGGECLSQTRKLPAEQFEDPDEIAGIADVHGVGEGRPGSDRLVVAGLQVLGDHIIGIAGGDKMFYGEAGAMGEKTGADVAEVAAGYADDGFLGLIRPLLPGKEIIELLGQPASDVDGIG